MSRRNVCGWMAVGVLTGLAAGCATVGYDRAGAMARNMSQTKQDVTDARRQVTATVTALEGIMRAQVGDFRPLLGAYSKNLATLGRMGENAAWRAQNIRESGGQYFAAWAQEIEAIQDPQLRANSVKRRDTIMADYREVEAALIKVRDSYKPMMKELLDIEKALQQDLTPSGVAAVKAPYQSARQKAVDLQTQMTDSLTVINRVVTELAPVATR